MKIDLIMHSGLFLVRLFSCITVSLLLVLASNAWSVNNKNKKTARPQWVNQRLPLPLPPLQLPPINQPGQQNQLQPLNVFPPQQSTAPTRHPLQPYPGSPSYHPQQVATDQMMGPFFPTHFSGQGFPHNENPNSVQAISAPFPNAYLPQSAPFNPVEQTIPIYDVTPLPVTGLQVYQPPAAFGGQQANHPPTQATVVFYTPASPLTVFPPLANDQIGYQGAVPPAMLTSETALQVYQPTSFPLGTGEQPFYPPFPAAPFPGEQTTALQLYSPPSFSPVSNTSPHYNPGIYTTTLAREPLSTEFPPLPATHAAIEQRSVQSRESQRESFETSSATFSGPSASTVSEDSQTASGDIAAPVTARQPPAADGGSEQRFNYADASTQTRPPETATTQTPPPGQADVHTAGPQVS